jgi:hypothetical protein
VGLDDGEIAVHFLAGEIYEGRLISLWLYKENNKLRD